MSLTDNIEYESKLYQDLSRILSKIGWTLKKGQHYNSHNFDIALYYEENLCTFIEIKHFKNKAYLNKLKNSGEEYIRKCLDNNLKYGILFINGNIYIVDKSTSKQVKSFPAPSEKEEVSEIALQKIVEPNNYDVYSIEVVSLLLELERKNNKISRLEKENKKLREENDFLRNTLFERITYLRNSLTDEELKLKLLDNAFNGYINSKTETTPLNYINSWCDNWEVLEANSKIFIRESENLHQYITEDYTAYIQGFAKALENEILIKIFSNFLKYFKKSNINTDYRITDNSNSGTIKVFRKFLTEGRLDNFLSLDRMRFIISAIFSDTNDKILLEFRSVYLNYFKEMKHLFSENGNINKIKVIRNLGAHTNPIKRQIAEDFYSTFKLTFNEILNNYNLQY